MAKNLPTYMGNVRLFTDSVSGETNATFQPHAEITTIGFDQVAALENLASELRSVADAIMGHARRLSDKALAAHNERVKKVSE